jgi:hypothetical protein
MTHHPKHRDLTTLAPRVTSGPRWVTRFERQQAESCARQHGADPTQATLVARCTWHGRTPAVLLLWTDRLELRALHARGRGRQESKDVRLSDICAVSATHHHGLTAQMSLLTRDGDLAVFTIDFSHAQLLYLMLSQAGVGQPAPAYQAC